MNAGRPPSRWIRYTLTGLLLLVAGISGYWFYAPVSHWSACGVSSSSRIPFTQVEPAEATLVVVVSEKHTNKIWRQYWAVRNTSQDSVLKLYAGVGTSKHLFGLKIPYQRRAFLTHIQPGRDRHRSIKSFTYDVKWLSGNN